MQGNRGLSRIERFCRPGHSGEHHTTLGLHGVASAPPTQGECVLGQGQAKEWEDRCGLAAVLAEPGGDAAVPGQAQEIEGGVA